LAKTTAQTGHDEQNEFPFPGQSAAFAGVMAPLAATAASVPLRTFGLIDPDDHIVQNIDFCTEVH